MQLLKINSNQYEVDIDTYFDDLYRTYYDSVRNYISKLSGSYYISEEITQEVFIKLYKNICKIKHNNIKGWLYKVAHNEVINYFKKNSKEILNLNIDFKDISNNPEDKIEEYHKKTIISKVLMKMPQKQVTALLLKDMDGYSYQEIAVIMGKSCEAIKSLLYRARQKFIKYYEEVNNDEV